MVNTTGFEERFTVMVSLKRLQLVEERHSDLVASLIKAIAHYTGGPSATGAAYEEDLSTDLGMRFVFLDSGSRDLFWRRVFQYCDQVTLDAITLSSISTLDDFEVPHYFVQDRQSARVM